MNRADEIMDRAAKAAASLCGSSTRRGSRPPTTGTTERAEKRRAKETNVPVSKLW
jgi:hypothetical protein